MSERVALKMRQFAVEVHRLAYQVPAGQGEYALLQLSQQMREAADEVLRPKREMLVYPVSTTEVG